MSFTTKVNILITVSIIHSAVCVIRNLPPNFPHCKSTDPNINKCILEATELVRPILRKGVPELNLPPISKFFIPEITLERGTGAVNFQAKLTNLTIYGLDDYQFSKFDFDTENLRFDTAVLMPALHMSGQYEITGNILVAPVQGKGHFHNNITNSKGTLKQQAKLVERKGVTYLISDKVETKIEVGEIVDYGFDGLFDGNEVLAKATEVVIRDHAKEIVSEMTPAVEEVMTKLFDDIIFKAISKIPYNKLL